MGDPSMDPLAIGGGGVAGAGVVFGVVRLVFGSAMADLKEKMVELKADLTSKIVEQRSDTREQIQSLKEMIQRSDSRHDLSVGKLAVVEQSLGALHSRLDGLVQRLESVERRCIAKEHE